MTDLVKTAYKLLRVRKDGSLGSLFINRKAIIPRGHWINAEYHPTKGYAPRRGWHCCKAPKAMHLSEKNRVWKRVIIKEYTVFERPIMQGGTWYIANKMKIVD